MDWQDLDVIVKTNPWAKAGVSVLKDGKPRLTITFSEPMFKDCGNPTRCDAQFAVRDGKALIRLAFKAAGKFEIAELEKGGARIRGIQVKEPVPARNRDVEPCEVEVKNKQEAILILPLLEWQAQVANPAVNVSSAQGARAAEAPKPQGRPSQAQPLDAAEYLKSKGIACRKLAGSWWDVDKERVPAMEVLTLVNTHRRKANLLPLTVDEIR